MRPISSLGGGPSVARLPGSPQPPPPPSIKAHPSDNWRLDKINKSSSKPSSRRSIPPASPPVPSSSVRDKFNGAPIRGLCKEPRDISGRNKYSPGFPTEAFKEQSRSGYRGELWDKEQMRGRSVRTRSRSRSRSLSRNRTPRSRSRSRSRRSRSRSRVHSREREMGIRTRTRSRSCSREREMAGMVAIRNRTRSRSRSRSRVLSREREITGMNSGGRDYIMRRSRSRSRSRSRDLVHLSSRAGPSGSEEVMFRVPMRDSYKERYKMVTPPPPHYAERPVIEEARRNYRGERPPPNNMPIEISEKSRGFSEDYRSSSRDRPPNVVSGPSTYEHPSRGGRYEDVDRYREERRPYVDFERSRPREAMRSSPQRFRGRYSPSPPHYARGAVQSGNMPNRRADDPNRQFEPDLPVGARRMESDMPVGGRRMNDCLPEGPPQRIGEDPHLVRGRMADVPMPRGRMDGGMPIMRAPMEMERPTSREVGDHFRERRELRRSRSPSPGRPRSGYVDNYGPRGGEVPPYDMGAHIMPDRYGSPGRPSGREPIPDSDMRRRPPGSPRQPWHEPPRNPEPQFVRSFFPDGSPFRDYGPARRHPPSFRGAEEPLPPGIEAQMRRDIDDRGRKRSPSKGGKRSRRSRSRRSRSKSGSRSKIRSSISPRKIRRHSKPPEPGPSRAYPLPEEGRVGGRHPHAETMLGSNKWPPNASPTRPNAGPSVAPPSTGREMWLDEHAPVRMRIDDGPDCRLIINKKRSATGFPEGSDSTVKRDHLIAGGSGQVEERRRMTSPARPLPMERGEHMRIKSVPVPPSAAAERIMRGGSNVVVGNAGPGGGNNHHPRGGGPPPMRRGGGGGTGRMRSGGPPDRGGARLRDDKKPIFDRLDSGRRGGHWPR